MNLEARVPRHARAARSSLSALALSALLAALWAFAPPQASGQAIEPPFDSPYSLTDLGPPPGVPSELGGLTLKAGTTDRLLIGGAANTAEGALYEVSLTRDVSGHITGFGGTATRFADAAYDDGGVTYGPGGVLFLARWPVNELGQTKPGSSISDKVIDLAPFGVAPSPGALLFVPPGQPGAGSLKLASWEGGEWYDADVTPDGSGTYDLQNVMPVAASTLPGGPEGFIYVNPGSPQFSTPSMLVSEWSAGNVAAYEVDANGDPLIATRRTFISGLIGAEGAFSDPVTGDFLFSTFGGGDRVIVVRGFALPSAEADLSLTKSDSPDPATVGGSLTYNLAVVNAGPSGAADVSVTDSLPASVTFVSASPSQGSCSQSAGTVWCSLGMVASGGTATVAIVVTPSSAGTIVNSASASTSSGDPNPASNADSEATTVQGAGAMAPAKASFAGSRSSIRVDRRGRFRFSFRASPRLTGTAVFASVGKVRVSPRRNVRRRVTLARKSFTVPASGKVTLRIRLSKRSFRILRLNRRIRTRVTVTLRNAAGLTSTASKRITLKAP